MDVHLQRLAAGQDDIVAAWQLAALGWTYRAIEHRVHTHGWRPIHAGVFALAAAPLRPRQLWFAARLTTPESVLAHASAAACWGYRPFAGRFEVVARPGSGGRRRIGRLLVCRSSTLAEDVTSHQGIAITTAARTLLDLSPELAPWETARAFREAVRLQVTTAEGVAATVSRHRGRRGTRVLRELCSRYAEVPYGRTRSNAEARALEVLADAGVKAPLVNVSVAGEEADLVWPDRELILEIDGPQYHLFPAEDEGKARRWRRAGYTVRRLPSDAVYHRPADLIRLASG